MVEVVQPHILQYNDGRFITRSTTERVGVYVTRFEQHEIVYDILSSRKIELYLFLLF